MAVSRRDVLRVVPPLLAVWVAGRLDAQKKTKAKWAVRMVELSVRRSSDEGVITVEGRARNIGGHSIPGLVLIFDVISSDGDVASRRRGKIDQTVFEPGEETEFTWQMDDQARGVEVKVSALTGGGMEVQVEQPGPYTIE